jgi:hypothetical protein
MVPADNVLAGVLCSIRLEAYAAVCDLVLICLEKNKNIVSLCRADVEVSHGSYFSTAGMLRRSYRFAISYIHHPKAEQPKTQSQIFPTQLLKQLTRSHRKKTKKKKR